MTRYKKTELVLDKTFNNQSCRHKIDDCIVVMHCHHYSTLYTQLALDCSMLDAKALLAECSEGAWLEFLSDHFRSENVTDVKERIALGEAMYAAAGLGKMHVDCASTEAGEVTLLHSHVDEGWIKKWGKHGRSVNFIGGGFITALFAAAFDKPAKYYVATETQSIVCGAPNSRFTVVAS